MRPGCPQTPLEISNDCELQKSAVVYGSMGWWALINLTSTGSFACYDFFNKISARFKMRILLRFYSYASQILKLLIAPPANASKATTYSGLS